MEAFAREVSGAMNVERIVVLLRNHLMKREPLEEIASPEARRGISDLESAVAARAGFATEAANRLLHGSPEQTEVVHIEMSESPETKVTEFFDIGDAESGDEVSKTSSMMSEPDGVDAFWGADEGEVLRTLGFPA